MKACEWTMYEAENAEIAESGLVLTLDGVSPEVHGFAAHFGTVL
jgi:hypothetical protein